MDDIASSVFLSKEELECHPIVEDVHSQLLNKDWYPILLIAGYNVGDLVGKSLTALYLLQNAKIAIASCIARLLFFPLFFGCLHGPKFFRTEIPVTILTCLLARDY